MSRQFALPAALLLAVSVAHAADASVSASGQAGSTSAQASASVAVPTDLKSAKAAAAASAASSRDAAISAGFGAMLGGKSAAAASTDAAKAAAATAKQSALSMKDAAITQAQNSSSAATGQSSAIVTQGKAIASQIQMDAAKRISLKDRAALAKYFAASQATSKAMSKVFGSSGSNDAPPAGYEGKLALNAKLDASLESSVHKVDASAVVGLSAQPKGTELLQIGKKVVRIDSATRVVLDVTPI